MAIFLKSPQHLATYLSVYSNRLSFLFFVIFLIASIVYPVPSFANPTDYRYEKSFRVQRINMEQGLSQSVVSDIIQDREGYVWLATEDGLNRFDGYDFKVFRHDYLDEGSIHENWTIKLLEEPGLGIWVGTAAGITFYDYTTGNFNNYSEAGSDLRSMTTALQKDQSNNIWVGTDRGLFYIDSNRTAAKRFVSNLGEKIERSVATLAENNDYLFAGGYDCIHRIDKESHAIYDLCLDSPLESIRSKKINLLLINENKLWIGTTDGLFSYDLLTKQLNEFRHQQDEPNSLSDNYIQDLVFDSKNILWIATTEGVNAYSEEDNKFIRYQRKIYAEDGLSANDALCLFIDDSDLLWVGTYTGGFNILDPNQNRFDHILNHSDVVNLGKNNTVHGIEKDRNDNLWIASYGGGLIRYNLLSAELSRPLNDVGFEYDKYVYALLVDHKEYLWIGSLDDLYMYDLKNSKILETTIYVDNKSIEALNSVNNIYEDSNGVVWLGRSTGLLKVYSTKKTNNQLEIRARDVTYEFPSSFNRYNPAISSIVHASDGSYWFGGTAGLLHYKPTVDEWVHFQNSRGNHQSLSNDSVQTIFEDSRGFIWVGTADGLNLVIGSKIDIDAIYFERITTHNGLPNNAIYGVLEDDAGQLWISTNAGIVNYSRSESNMGLYNAVDGISSDEFNTGAHFTDADGRLYFGSINGITVIKPKVAIKENLRNRLLFSKVKIGERELDVKFLNDSEKPSIIQQQDEMSIDIKMVNIDYAKLGTQRYRYKLHGFSENWFYLGKQRNIFLAGLDEGRYELEVQSQKVGQNWQVEPKRLSIVVKTDYWNSRAGYLTIALILLTLFAISLYYVRVFYRRKIHLIDKKLIRESVRLRELRVDNDVLKKEVLKKENTVLNLREQAEEKRKQLDSEKYRDITTGFFKIDYLRQLKQNTETEERQPISNNQVENGDEELGVTTEENRVSITLFELTGTNHLISEHGKLALAEVLVEVASDIRKILKPGNQIFIINDGLFAFCNFGSSNATIEHQKNVNYLASYIERSVFDVLNGISISCSVAFTIFEISDVIGPSDLSPWLKPKSLDYLLAVHSGLGSTLKTGVNNHQNLSKIRIIDQLSLFRFLISFNDEQSFMGAIEEFKKSDNIVNIYNLLDSHQISLKQLSMDEPVEIL